MARREKHSTDTPSSIWGVPKGMAMLYPMSVDELLHEAALLSALPLLVSPSPVPVVAYSGPPHHFCLAQ